MVKVFGSNWEEFLIYLRMNENAITLLTQSSADALKTLIRFKKDSVFRRPSSNVKNRNYKAINFTKHSTYIHVISIVSFRRIEGQNNFVLFVFISGIFLTFMVPCIFKLFL
jgi:hypothetical protein